VRLVEQRVDEVVAPVYLLDFVHSYMRRHIDSFVSRPKDPLLLQPEYPGFAVLRLKFEEAALGR
jgi:hypothetical protein